MPTKRLKTKYPGVYFIMGRSVSTGKPERIFYIRYRKDGKQIEEKAGRQYQDDMTAAKAATLRAKRIDGIELSNEKRRQTAIAMEKAEQGKWTIGKLFDAYIETRSKGKSKGTDTSRYNKHLKAVFGDKEPKEIIPLDIERLKRTLQKKLAPQTVKHILNLLTWVINYGTKNGICEGLSFQIKKPTVNNTTTEDLTPEQLKRLLIEIDKHPNIQISNLMRMALYSGMRRGELFKLRWEDINFDRGFILIKDPKGGLDQQIPLNDKVRELLKTHPRAKDSPYVFPGAKGKQRVTCSKGVNQIKKAAGLPKGFRPMHGLRHHFASMLASSGQVDMFALQRLLTHKDGRMTARYAHLRDSALNRASNLAGSLIDEIVNDKTEKVVNLDGNKK